MNKRSVIGILIIAVGLLALGGALGYYEVDGIWSTFWPVIFIAIGLVNLIDNPKNYLFTGFVIVLGTVFLLRNLGVEYLEDLRFWEMFWPICIITAGIWLISGKKAFHIGDRSKMMDERSLEAFALFSGVNIKNASSDFKGGDIFAMFGGIDLDLRQARIGEIPAAIDIFVMFGGVDIKVPEDWKVKVTGIPLFGGWGNKTIMKQTDKEVDLVINVFVMFGGMDVKN